MHDFESLQYISVVYMPRHHTCTELLKGKANQSAPMYVNAIQGAEENEFSVKIKHDYSDLFTGIGNMNTTIDIKLSDDAVLYVAAIRRVAHALQEPLRLELEKLVDESILRKLKIDEKSEWLNSFVCMPWKWGQFLSCAYEWLRFSILLANHTLLYELLDVIGHFGPKYCISCPKETSLLTFVFLMYVLEHLWSHLSWHYDSVSTSNES